MRKTSAPQSERVTFLTSVEQKAALDAFAAERGESVGNVVREATTRYIAEPISKEEEEVFKLLVQELDEAVPKMRSSLERSIARLRSTREEVDKMLREAGLRK